MLEEERKIIESLVSNKSIEKAIKAKIDVTSCYTANKNYYYYRVYDMRSDYDYNCFSVHISKRYDGNYDIYCSCKDYDKNKECKHIAYCLIEYRKDIFKIKSMEELLSVSKKIFNKHKITTQGIKKELSLDLELVIEYHTLFLKVKIGLDKLYSLNSKYRNFFDCYRKEKGTVEFGKSFIYDPKLHYFSDKNKELLDFIYYNCTSNGNDFSLNTYNIGSFFQLFGELRIRLNTTYINGIKNGFPLDTVLQKNNDDNYELLLNNISDINELTPSYEYVEYENNIYHLNSNERELLKELTDKNLKKLVFKKKDIEAFSHSILPTIKKNICVDNDITDIVISKEPISNLYFGINRDKINCELKLDYDGTIIQYFEKNNKVLRDDLYEQNVINDITNCGFNINKDNFIMDNIDLIGDFLDNKINELTDKYNVFTSEKLKKLNIYKKTSISSTFSLGEDNIMHYDFNATNISSDELMNMLSGLRKKQRYYRLKSGDIVSLEDDNIKELDNLTKDLDIKEGSGEIPKYRAIYLDSLRDTRYHIIKTDNLFDNFIKTFNEYKNVKLDFTKKEEELLRSYQISGIKWLYNLYKCDLGGILADEMGLGKTLQTIIFIRKLLLENKNAKFLIVAPTALLYNWYKEFERFASEISVRIVASSKVSRQNILDDFKESVFITSYGLVREDADIYKDKVFTVVIIDEAQNIKNPLAGITKSVKSIKTRTKLALTGTPIENSIIELWSIFDFIMPGFLASQTNFHSKYNIGEINEDSEITLNNLKNQVKPFILRRRKKDVLTDLPDKIENIIYIDLDDTQQKIYMAEVKETRRKMDELLASGDFLKVRFQILTLITRLRQICIDPHIIYENYNGDSAKTNHLISLIKEYKENGHKMLLFTSFKTALELIRKELNNNNISNYTIDGSVSSLNRQKLVDSFNGDSTDVFLIMLKSGGIGLNLTSADVVIHLDPWWNPQSENQATDRAHRIGQKNNVEVIKLITKGTIEEKIIDLQKKKKLLSDKLIENETTTEDALGKLNEKDIRNLLAYENKDE